MARAFRILTPFLPEGVIVFIIPLLHCIPFIVFTDAFYIDAMVNIHPEPIGALYPEAQRGGAGHVGIMLYLAPLSDNPVNNRLVTVPEVEPEIGLLVTVRPFLNR